MKLIKFLNGKKTFFVAILTGVGATLTIFGIHIPEFAWAILGALGLGAVRSAIKKIEK